MKYGEVIHHPRREVSVFELMICVRNYRPSVICIGRRLTNSALAASAFSPMAISESRRKYPLNIWHSFKWLHIGGRMGVFSIQWWQNCESCPLSLFIVRYDTAVDSDNGQDLRFSVKNSHVIVIWSSSMFINVCQTCVFWENFIFGLGIHMVMDDWGDVMSELSMAGLYLVLARYTMDWKNK